MMWRCTCKDSDTQVKECQRYECRGRITYLVSGILPPTYRQKWIKVDAIRFHDLGK